MISEGDLAVMKIVATAGSVTLAVPFVRTHLLTDLDSDVSEETIDDLVSRACEAIIVSAPRGFSFQKACGYFLLRVALDEYVNGENASTALAVGVQSEINRMLGDV